ncbi:methyltransferase OMS1 [Microdochium nivale]|nr:methyltransferase OMS1 [Microdochium nivale]
MRRTKDLAASSSSSSSRFPPVPQTPSSQRPLTSPSPPPQTPPQYYDTIVQTFGLCSVRDPVSLIANMAHLVRPGTGRIVMVEHGLSVWELVNGLLDRSARGHFERFGCWWNRDVEVIVHDAVRTVPGLEIVAFERPGWATGGTHLWIELKMAATAAAAAAPLADEENPAADHAKTDGWFGLGSFMTVKKAKEMLPSSTLSPSGGGAPENTDAKEGENDSKQG